MTFFDANAFGFCPTRKKKVLFSNNPQILKKNMEDIFWYSKSPSGTESKIYTKKSKWTQKYVNKSPIVKKINLISYIKNFPIFFFRINPLLCVVFYCKIWKMNLPSDHILNQQAQQKKKWIKSFGRQIKNGDRVQHCSVHLDTKKKDCLEKSVGGLGYGCGCYWLIFNIPVEPQEAVAEFSRIDNV